MAIEGDDAEIEEVPTPRRGPGRPPSKVKLQAQYHGTWFDGQKYAKDEEIYVDKSDVDRVTASGAWKEPK